VGRAVASAIQSVRGAAYPYDDIRAYQMLDIDRDRPAPL
jgi:hypothetical protein